MRPSSVAGLALGLLLLGMRLAAADTIKQIVVQENTKTTDDTVLYVAGIEEGDDWDQAVQDQVKRDLISCGLFKDVEVFSEPHPKGGVKVTILAKDKLSWIIAPTYYNQPTNKAVGLGYGENNLFGENKKLLLYGQIVTGPLHGDPPNGDSFLVGAYVDPSIHGTPFSWQIDTLLKRSRVIEYAVPTKFLEQTKPVRESLIRYLNGGLKLGVNLFRRLQLSARLRGAWVSYGGETQLAEGASLADVGIDPTTCRKADLNNCVPDPGKSGWDISTEFVARWDRRANFYGISTGNKYEFSYEKSQPALGSDFNYHYSTASVEFARRYFTNANFVVKAMVGYGKHMPFEQEYASGGTSLRGYKGAQFRGDFKVAGNAEYSVQIFNIKGFALRGLAFFDSAYTEFKNPVSASSGERNYLPGEARESALAPFKNSVGVGTRIYIRQIVLPLLGLDLGYGLEGGGVEVYFAIGLTDL